MFNLFRLSFSWFIERKFLQATLCTYGPKLKIEVNWSLWGHFIDCFLFCKIRRAFFGASTTGERDVSLLYRPTQSHNHVGSSEPSVQLSKHSRSPVVHRFQKKACSQSNLKKIYKRDITTSRFVHQLLPHFLLILTNLRGGKILIAI